VAFSEIDRQLLQRCLARQPRAWEDFVDRFLGLVVHVVRHTTQSRSIAIAQQDMEDLSSEVFVAILADDFGVLRRFRGQSSLATYLTVVSRRVVVRELLKRRIIPNLYDTADMDEVAESGEPSVVERISNREEVARLLDELQGEEADIVRLFHIDGKTYAEISQQTGVPENSIGPTLSKARAKLRRHGHGMDAATT
jgi:RNA polymerase sigma-70 factor (ECF subfamily)